MANSKIHRSGELRTGRVKMLVPKMCHSYLFITVLARLLIQGNQHYFSTISGKSALIQGNQHYFREINTDSGKSALFQGNQDYNNSAFSV